MSLQSSPIRDEGVAMLTGLKSLRAVWLFAYTDITNVALEHVNRLTGLQRLDLAGTDIGNPGRAAQGHDRADIPAVLAIRV